MMVPSRAIPDRHVRLWAWIDGGVAVCLGLPVTAHAFVALLYRSNGWLGSGLDAASVPPTFAPIHWLLACLCGAMVGVWALARLLWPSPQLAFLDTLGRVWVAALIVFFVAVAGAPPVLLVFVVSEVAGAVAQGWVLWSRRLSVP